MEHPVDDDEGNLAMCLPAPAVVQFQVLTKMGKGPRKGSGDHYPIPVCKWIPSLNLFRAWCHLFTIQPPLHKANKISWISQGLIALVSLCRSGVGSAALACLFSVRMPDPSYRHRIAKVCIVVS